jgi:hypothetical protein
MLHRGYPLQENAMQEPHLPAALQSKRIEARPPDIGETALLCPTALLLQYLREVFERTRIIGLP